MSQKIKPSLSKGTRDFLPREVAKRNYIFETIKAVFRKYGFEQIETPAIERLETLTGKYGDEGDKLLFKILNSGDYLKDVPDEVLTTHNSQLATKHIAEKGLRYDLTVPLARYVVQHKSEITFPFKRFHIGPVWRADRPQKGRYQEFYQCDADVIGSTSLWNEVELTQIFLEVYKALKIPVTILVNHRLYLQRIGDFVKQGAITAEIIAAFDKCDKIGIDGVLNELSKYGLSQEELNLLRNVLSGTINYLNIEIQESEEGKKAHNDLSKFFGQFTNESAVIFYPALARGLDYYTGIIWEVVCNGVQMGSIASGGRYDNLTEMFGGQNLSGVGISFGIERIYDVMEELNLFPDTISQGVKILFVPREPAVEEFTYTQVQTLRDAGIGAEIFLGNVKKQKQFDYATAKGILYIAEIGQDEVASGVFRVKNISTREEIRQNIDELLHLFISQQ
ncbi:MAG: histidine--tRNA ligase [Chitinophagales bacterium]|nr:histidine--tRNA ligase [Chitinophagales bacterium]